MLQHNPMSDSRNALPLVKTGLAQKRPGRHKENPLPDTLLQFLENIGRQHDSTAAAAGSAGVGGLLLTVVDFYAADRKSVV